MRIYKRWEETKVIEHQQIESIICDWCGGNVERESFYDTRDFDFEFTKGTNCQLLPDKSGSL